MLVLPAELTHDQAGASSRMLAQGLRGFIPKPYSREKLLDQVRQTLDAARRPH